MKDKTYILHLCTLAVIFIIAIAPNHVYAQRTIFLNSGNLGSLDLEPSGVFKDTINVGEIIDIDVWYDVGKTTQISGMNVFIQFDDASFEVIDQNPTPLEFQPFKYDNGAWTAFKQPFANQMVGNNVIASHLSVDTDQGTISGAGRFGRFQLRALKRVFESKVVIIYDPGKQMDTRMFFLDLTERQFDERIPLTINVVGIGIEGLPDALLEPGESRPDFLDLDDYITNEAEEQGNFIFEVTEDDSVLVTIDPTTHMLSIQIANGFIGFRNISVTVIDEFNVSVTDVMRIVVSYRPNIGPYLTESSILFNEDEIYSDLWLDTLATDSDNAPEALIWEAYSLSPEITLSIVDSSRKVTFVPEENWSGQANAVFRVSDIHGMFDTTMTAITVLPVNDLPWFFNKIPDISLLPGEKDSTLVMENFVDDIDTDFLSLLFHPTGNTEVIVTSSPAGLQSFIIDSNSGFIGTETLYMNVRESSTGLVVAVDTFTVTFGAKPPVIIGLPDTVVQSGNVINYPPYVNLNDYVIDPDNLIEELVWSIEETGDLMANIDGSQVSWVIPAQLHSVEHVIFTATDPLFASDSDTVQVFVVHEGRPLITGLPDDFFIPSGQSVEAFDLDDFVYYEDPSEELTWVVNFIDKINVTIDPETHVVTISSIDPAYVGTETVKFIVVDESGKTDEHTMEISAIKLDTPILSDIPDIDITRNKPGSMLLNDYLRIFPDTLAQFVKWSVSPASDPKVLVALNPITGGVNFSVLDIDFRGSRDFTFTATNSLNNKSASDEMSVNVSFGISPILGRLPNIEFQSGDTLHAYNLDKYVIDPDTHDDSLSWSFDAAFIQAREANFEPGANHDLVIWSFPGYNNIEDVILTVTDPEGNAASDTIEVRVTSSSTLTMRVIQSPVSSDYFDFVVFASDSLVGSPQMVLYLNNDPPQELVVSRISSELIWKSDYVFDIGAIGEALVVATAADNIGSEIQDSVKIELLASDLFGKVSFSNETVTLNLDLGSDGNSERIVLIPDGETQKSQLYYSNIPLPLSLEYPVLSYFIGPKKFELVENSNIKIDLISLGIPVERTEKYGLYLYDEATGGKTFISPVNASRSTEILSEFTQFGRYFIAADVAPPNILNLEEFDAERMSFVLSVREDESGIRRAEVMINGRYMNNSLRMRSDGFYVIEIDEDYTETGPMNALITVIDRAGNISETEIFSMDIDKPPLPKSFSLSQNYPNPFNPETTIEYRLPESQQVVINIYNLTGQLVNRLVSGQKEAGYHTVRWNGKTMNGVQAASGIYIYSIKTNNYSHSRKMLLVK